jgi:hypothetical protein
MVIGAQEYNVTNTAGFPVSKSTGVVALHQFNDVLLPFFP